MKVIYSAMLRQGSDSIFLKSPFFLVKQGFFCLIAMKVGDVVKNLNSQLLMRKTFKIFLKSGTEHAPKKFNLQLRFRAMKCLP